MPIRKHIVELPQTPEDKEKLQAIGALLEADKVIDQRRDEIVELQTVSADILVDLLDGQDLLDKQTWADRDNVGKIYLALRAIFFQRFQEEIHELVLRGVKPEDLPTVPTHNEHDFREKLYELLGSSRQADRIKDYVMIRLEEEQLIAYTQDYRVVFRDFGNEDYIELHAQMLIDTA